MAALLGRVRRLFDVLVTENMLGDILSDLTGELAGSLGIVPARSTLGRDGGDGPGGARRGPGHRRPGASPTRSG